MNNSTKKLLTLIIFNTITLVSLSQLIPFSNKGKWGFASKDGKNVVPCIYDEVDFFSDDTLALVKKVNKYGYINKKGVVVIPIIYDKCYRIYEVYHGEHYVGINHNPEIHLEKDFDFADINNNKFIVSKNGKFGIIHLINGKPQTLIPFNYSKIKFDIERKVFHCYINDENIRYFSMKGTELTQMEASNIPLTDYAYAARGDNNNLISISKLNGKKGIVKKVNSYRNPNLYDTIIPAIYDNIIIEKQDKDTYIRNDFFGVLLNGQWGFINNSNQIVLPIEYDSINFELSNDFRHWAIYNRMFIVNKDDNWGIIAKKNELNDTIVPILPFEYSDFNKIYYNFLSAQKDGKYQIFNIDTYKLISDKSYTSIEKYKYESVNGFHLFITTNKAGEKVYVGQNGVDFFIE